MADNQSHFELSPETIDSIMDYMSSSAAFISMQKNEINELRNKVATVTEQVSTLAEDNSRLQKIASQASTQKFANSYYISESSAEKIVKQLKSFGIFKTANINDHISELRSDPNCAFGLLEQVADMFADSTFLDVSVNNKYAALVKGDATTSKGAVTRDRYGNKLPFDIEEAKLKVASENKNREIAFLSKHKFN